MTARGRSVSSLPPSLAPRGLSRSQSAQYIGVGVSKFDQMVRDGRKAEAGRWPDDLGSPRA
jgi:hypothetical protein